jgi:hypothetical protein
VAGLTGHAWLISICAGTGGARPQQGRARPECPCAAGTGSGPGGARPEPAQTRPEPARARPGCPLRGWGGAGALRDGSDGVGSALGRKTKTEIKADSEKGKILQKKKNEFICFSGLAGNVRIFYVGFAAKPSNIRIHMFLQPPVVRNIIRFSYVPSRVF